ncbi:hypothetical protein L1987_49902 [Smallanthus sonchifolius]|uniref:Uncharacterized protein n=1 Tax=Smallanthus sonchifolius TaxID=185202 RepID=A0ACB9FX14_9ASTR|nr:hypothetical protein L1987_49902 [Smallanthus sonchifolius]
MEKHVIPPSTPLIISNKNPIKRTVIRKNRNKKHTTKDLINKVVSYLISDCYMYNPLVSPQPSLDFPPPPQIFTSPGKKITCRLHFRFFYKFEVTKSLVGIVGIHEDVALPIKGSNKKLFDEVVDFLEVDCYLYSPVVTNEHVCSKSHATSKSSGGQMQKGTVRGGEDLSRQLRATSPVVKKTVAYRESMKHMSIDQMVNCWFPVSDSEFDEVKRWTSWAATNLGPLGVTQKSLPHHKKEQNTKMELKCQICLKISHSAAKGYWDLLYLKTHKILE